MPGPPSLDREHGPHPGPTATRTRTGRGCSVLVTASAEQIVPPPCSDAHAVPHPARLALGSPPSRYSRPVPGRPAKRSATSRTASRAGKPSRFSSKRCVARRELSSSAAISSPIRSALRRAARACEPRGGRDRAGSGGGSGAGAGGSSAASGARATRWRGTRRAGAPPPRPALAAAAPLGLAALGQVARHLGEAAQLARRASRSAVMTTLAQKREPSLRTRQPSSSKRPSRARLPQLGLAACPRATSSGG